ncbi:reverse transcriptase domain-containing protein [Tanacetum coccineum]
MHEVVRAYNVGSSDKKGYVGTLTLWDKCNLHHHHGPCPVQSGNCKKVGHQARDCWTPTSVTCYKCGEKGHTRKYCLKLKNLNGAREACQDTNVVTGLQQEVLQLPGVPKRCNSSIGKTRGLLSFSRGIGWEGLITV